MSEEKIKYDPLLVKTVHGTNNWNTDMTILESNQVLIANNKLQRLEERKCMTKPEEERQSSCHPDEFQSTNLKLSEVWKTGSLFYYTSLFHWLKLIPGLYLHHVLQCCLVILLCSWSRLSSHAQLPMAI